MSKSKEGITKQQDTNRGEGVDQPFPESGEVRGAPDQSYYESRESYREFPRRSYSRRFPDRGQSDPSYREERPASFYNRAPLGTPSQFRQSSPRHENEPDRYRYADREEYGGEAPERYSNLDRGRYQTYEPQQYRQSEPNRFREGRYHEDFDSARSREQGWWQVQNNYLKCRDIMTKNVTTCTPINSLREVAEKMDDDDVGSIPVVDNGRLVGLITDRDIVCRAIAIERDTRTSTAADAMTQDVVTCSPDEPVIEAVNKMAEFMIRRMPIVDHSGRLRGMVSMADIALEAELNRDLARALHKISRPTPYRSRRYANSR